MSLLSDPWFNAQFERTIGHTSVGGADLGECFSIKRVLEASSFEGWFDAWLGLGDKLAKQAKDYEYSGQHYSAHCAYLRASNYYRTSYFFLDENPTDSRIEKAYDASCAMFKKALLNSALVYEPLMIPYEDTHLPGYLFLPDMTQKNWPLIIDTGGGDAIKEELFFNSVGGALKRGYAALIFDGPGQGTMLRKQALPFRPDWEVVITAVIDHMLKLNKINANQIILYGSSFGGYLAPRAATVEHRIAACIANPGILNATGVQAGSFPKHIQQAMARGDDATVNDLFAQLSQKDKMKGFLFESRKIRFGADTIADMFKKTSHYKMEQTVTDIQCPMLVLDNELEHITKGQAKQLFDALTNKKKHYHLFKAVDGHSGHCQPLSHCHTNEMIFSWLNQILL